MTNEVERTTKVRLVKVRDTWIAGGDFDQNGIPKVYGFGVTKEKAMSAIVLNDFEPQAFATGRSFIAGCSRSAVRPNEVISGLRESPIEIEIHLES